MDEKGPDDFVFGTEESHGYLIGQYVRDKDGAAACLLMCQLAADLKAHGKSLHERLDELYQLHGYHHEDLINVQMEGSEGMELMNRVMKAFRSEPPRTLGGIAVQAIRDYGTLTKTKVGSKPEPMAAPQGNMVILDLATPGNSIAIRPSGTEPKVKFYFFTSLPKEESQDLVSAKRQLAERTDAFQKDIKAFAQAISASDQ
jgi:phosphoglucomutase/phosphomannomutase